MGTTYLKAKSNPTSHLAVEGLWMIDELCRVGNSTTVNIYDQPRYSEERMVNQAKIFRGKDDEPSQDCFSPHICLKDNMGWWWIWWRKLVGGSFYGKTFILLEQSHFQLIFTCSLVIKLAKQPLNKWWGNPSYESEKQQTFPKKEI